MVSAWLTYAQRRLRQPENTTVLNDWPSDVLSHFRVECSRGAVPEALVPIEPLIGFLRHPRYLCIGGSPQWIYDKSYMLPLVQSELWPRGPRRRALFFDLGASLYTSGAGGASQSWFDRMYARHGLNFSRIYAWEARPYSDAQILAALPPPLREATSIYRSPPAAWGLAGRERLSYFNFGVSPRPDSSADPWRVLREEARASDFVVVKVDVDTPGVERPLVARLLDEPTLLRLVDEMYYEHHVLNSPMMGHGWGQDKANLPNETLRQSYALFRRLREGGVRAHSWV